MQIYDSWLASQINFIFLNWAFVLEKIEESAVLSLYKLIDMIASFGEPIT